MTLVVPPNSGPAPDEPTTPADETNIPEPRRPAVGRRAPGDESITAAVGRLGPEFCGRGGAHLGVRVAGDARRELGGSPVGALPELVERLARYRLDRHIG